MRCLTFVVLAGCLVVAGSVRVVGAQAATHPAAVGSVTITVEGRSYAGKYQSVEGISLLAERADVIDKPTGRGLTAAPSRTDPKPITFAIGAAMSDPLGAFLMQRRSCVTSGDRSGPCLFDVTLTTAGGTFVARRAWITSLALPVAHPPEAMATGKLPPATVRATFVAQSMSRQ